MKFGDFQGGELFVYDADGKEKVTVEEKMPGNWGKHLCEHNKNHTRQHCDICYRSFAVSLAVTNHSSALAAN